MLAEAVGASGVVGSADGRGLAADGAAGPSGEGGGLGCGALADVDGGRSTLSGGAGWAVAVGGEPGPLSGFSVDCASAGALTNRATARAAKMVDIAQLVRLSIR